MPCLGSTCSATMVHFNARLRLGWSDATPSSSQTVPQSGSAASSPQLGGRPEVMQIRRQRWKRHRMTVTAKSIICFVLSL
ncbi:hypothetical protein PVAP13_2NG625950 [Panicum virgatum]|uniref:Uncharacterized protein n=1 Tax=Panicum virgatum TaxID=38727 RepID=A0A8T0W2T0_PANVG|nr:hypothetical protein PVAP13_2NG625950 [Panicum virgatum]